MSLPSPINKKEAYLYAMATGENDNLPSPGTRKEEYLKAIAEKDPAAGTPGPKGDKGDTGAAGKGVKSISLTATDGAITGGAVTFSDDSTAPITVTTA